MNKWLRRVLPDIFLAACVALLLTVVMNELDTYEANQIVAEVRWAADGGLTLDERLGAFERSIRRSTLMYIPGLVAMAGLLVALICRNRRRAWLTSILAVIPAVLIGASFLIDRPVWAAGLVAVYAGITVSVAATVVAVRNRLNPVVVTGTRQAPSTLNPG